MMQANMVQNKAVGSGATMPEEYITKDEVARRLKKTMRLEESISRIMPSKKLA